MYRPHPSALHAARAGAGCLFCLAFTLAALIVSAPLLLAALALSVVLAGMAAGVGRQMRRAAQLAVPLAILVLIVNAIVTRDGDTVIARLGDLPVLGHTDVTLEATVYGAVLGMRAFVLILCGALYSTAIDPDEVLRLTRRVSFRSALTATLATRLVPVLMRDSRRLADAQRCRPGPPPSRLALMRVSTAGVLDRALDVAATLEVRGYGTARCPPHQHHPYSRHDIAFTGAAVVVLGLVLVGRVGGVASFHAYPALHDPVGAREMVLAVMLVVAAVLPFLDRRGIES